MQRSFCFAKSLSFPSCHSSSKFKPCNYLCSWCLVLWKFKAKVFSQHFELIIKSIQLLAEVLTTQSLTTTVWQPMTTSLQYIWSFLTFFPQQKAFFPNISKLNGNYWNNTTFWSFQISKSAFPYDQSWEVVGFYNCICSLCMMYSCCPKSWKLKV